MHEVIPKLLWIGNAHDARDVRCMLALGITAVVDLAMEETPILYPRDVAHCRFPLVDGAGNTPAVIKAAISTISCFIRGEVTTLVTCSGGMSRSPTIIAAALAAIEGTTIVEALKRIAATGPHDVSTTLWAEVKEAIMSDR